jgi:hypothetical protein
MMLTAVNQYFAESWLGTVGIKPAASCAGGGCSFSAATTNARVTRPSMEVPFSTRPKLPFQRRSQSARAAGTAHHRWDTPVVNSSARVTPPISEASSRKETTTTTASGTRKKAMPNRSRMASGRVWWLTAASRPAISIRKAMHTVPTTIAQISW